MFDDLLNELRTINARLDALERQAKQKPQPPTGGFIAVTGGCRITAEQAAEARRALEAALAAAQHG